MKHLLIPLRYCIILFLKIPLICTCHLYRQGMTLKVEAFIWLSIDGRSPSTALHFASIFSLNLEIQFMKRWILESRERDITFKVINLFVFMILNKGIYWWIFNFFTPDSKILVTEKEIYVYFSSTIEKTYSELKIFCLLWGVWICLVFSPLADLFFSAHEKSIPCNALGNSLS